MKNWLKKAALAVAVAGSGMAFGNDEVSVRDLSGKNVVLVHGAWADGSSWSRVIPILEARGLHVVSVQIPLTSLEDDLAATRRVLLQQKGPVILVGHSWGGAVITEAGAAANVKALVYVAAFAPDKGQSVNDLQKGAPPAPWMSSLQVDSGGYTTLATDAFIANFAPDLPRGEARILAATQVPWYSGSLDEKIVVAAWRTKPSWFVITGQDHIIPTQAQDAMALGIHAHAVHVNSSHVVMLSHPQEVAETIVEAARESQ